MTQKTALTELIENFTENKNQYIKKRDGFKTHTSNWEVYDLMVREYVKNIELTESKLQKERQDLIEARIDGVNEGINFKEDLPTQSAEQYVKQKFGV